jgi:hypothetical protein
MSPRVGFFLRRMLPLCFDANLVLSLAPRWYASQRRRRDSRQQHAMNRHNSDEQPPQTLPERKARPLAAGYS